VAAQRPEGGSKSVRAPLAVVTLGAYVRLSDAGLGCPDWPGCYGHPTPAHAAEHIARAEAANPHGVVTLAKAWKEMAHRYAASTLGLLILILAGLAGRDWRAGRAPPPVLEFALVGLVIFQGLLGMWTVTLLLRPAIVSAHLIGGMTVFALLAWLALRDGLRGAKPLPEPSRPWLRAALLIILAQICLGGWVSSNYAALACADFPTCQGRWWPEAEFAAGFHWQRDLGHTRDGELLPLAALTAIHVSHRLGALLALLLVGGAGLSLVRHGRRAAGLGLLGLLAVQIGLGIGNVLASLPLPVAVAHNAGAALLLAGLMVLNLAAGRRQATPRSWADAGRIGAA
jgi:cytochrome c oxidase assembly protein subunit 15